MWTVVSIFDDPAYYEENPDWPTQNDTNWKTRSYYDDDFILVGTNYSKGQLTKTEVNTDTDSAAEIVTKYKYDKFGNIIEKREQIEALAEKIISFEYDVLGNLTKTIYPSGTVVENTYNEQNQLKKVKAPITP